MMNKRLILQLLVIMPFLETYILAASASIINNTNAPIYYGNIGQSNSLSLIAPNSFSNVSLLNNPTQYIIYPASSVSINSNIAALINGTPAIQLTYWSNNPALNNTQTCTITSGGIPTFMGPNQNFTGSATFSTDSSQPTGLALVSTSSTALFASSPLPNQLSSGQITAGPSAAAPIPTSPKFTGNFYNNTGTPVYISNDNTNFTIIANGQAKISSCLTNSTISISRQQGSQPLIKVFVTSASSITVTTYDATSGVAATPINIAVNKGKTNNLYITLNLTNNANLVLSKSTPSGAQKAAAAAAK